MTTSKEDYDSKLEVLQTIDGERLRPKWAIPMDEYIQDAANLFAWCQKDKENLIARGLAWELVDDIPTRAGALREAESIWSSRRVARDGAEKEWKTESENAYKLKETLTHELRFAFRKHPELMKQLKVILKGRSHSDMLQDLNDLSLLGRENSELLTATNFDMTLLERSASDSKGLAAIRAENIAQQAEDNAVKKIRDQAATYLKEALEEVYAYGQFVFREDEKRRKGYCSYYYRQKRASDSSQVEEPEPVDRPPDADDSDAGETVPESPVTT